MDSRSRGHRLRLALCLGYLLGNAAGLIHPLGETALPRCPDCESGPALVAVCEGGPCPSEHHHHPARSPHHDSTRCGFCQKHASGGFALSSPTGWTVLTARREFEIDRDLPGPSLSSTPPPARAPPA